MFSKIREMRKIVLKELEHIPKGPFPQGELRAVYWGMRMNSLGKKAKAKKTAKEVLEECLSVLRKDYSDFEFEYDGKFFNRKD